MIARLLKRLRSRNSLLTIGVLVLVGGGLFATVGRGSVPDLPTADVTRGEFVDTLEIRGEIRPLKSVVLSSPMQSGELQILKLAKNGIEGQGRRRRRRSSTARRCSGRSRRSSPS